ncbi:branched-chain amino acid ABC transporter permease [Phycicoccus sp. BSK3Z-2]|uniref:Branched-chain amino acid ABC transporter permease n=1 Tax=Phycicoccus avicenniae TaxID=2828860 RepID=A0A941D6R0_9MICO|nr:branched-chain amino acid ABC transporter permease [Phycicoccus avicenniae]MBR7742481.1 branched-chain amino acid ABC transporter permease [Phycicoccus avicenniae]
MAERTLALPDRLRRVTDDTLGRHLLAGLVGAVVVVLLLSFLGGFRVSQLASFSYLAIAAAGLTVLTGLNGQLSLGHGAFMAIGAYTTAVLQRTELGLPLVVVLVAAVLVAGAVGVVVGLAAARLHGPYIAGATLALAIAVPGLAIFWRDLLGGEQGLTVPLPDVPAWFADAVFFLTATDPSSSRYVAYLAGLALVAVLVLLANVARSRTGRRWQAVRDDEVAAQLAGIDLGRARVLAFVVSAACAGLAGGFMAFVVRLTAPSGFTLTLSLTLLTAIVLGGLGSLTGALIGAGLLTFLPQVVTSVGGDVGLSDVQSAELAPLVYGLVMVLVILLAPGGLVGTIRLKRAERAARRAAAAGATASTGAPTSADERTRAASGTGATTGPEDPQHDAPPSTERKRSS